MTNEVEMESSQINESGSGTTSDCLSKLLLRVLLHHTLPSLPPPLPLTACLTGGEQTQHHVITSQIELMLQ